MRSHTTHQVPATTKSSPLTMADLGITVATAAGVVFAIAFVVQTLIGWFTPASGTDGVCREYGNQVVVCVPAFSPDGAPMSRMWEDGSAVYDDGHVFGGYSEDAAETVGVYAVPGGELTVYGDASAYYAPAGS